MILTACALSLPSCDEPEPGQTEPPVLVLSDSTVTVPAAGEDMAVTYEIVNPAEDGNVFAAVPSDVDWVGGIEVSEGGSIAFTVSPNSLEETRSTELTVSYTWMSGSVEETVSVIQEGQESDQPADEPELSWGGAGNVSADGGPVSLLFSLVNPVEDGTLSVRSEAEWLSGLTVNDNNTVTGTASPNGTYESREAVVILEYTYCLGSMCSMKSAELTLVQDGQPVPEPAIRVNNSTVDLSSEGGEKTFEYWIENPAGDGEVSVRCDAGWLSGFDCSVDGVITYSVAENDTEETRTGVFTIVYTYGGETSVEKDITVVQSAPTETPEVTDPVQFSFNFTSFGSSGVTITVTADNETSWFLFETISYEQFLNSGKTWYETALDEVADTKFWADMFGEDVSRHAHQGTASISYGSMNADDLYVFAFAIDENWNITSEVQFAPVVVE